MLPGTLGCGPYLCVDGVGFWVSVVAFVILKPVAYFAFIQAFRYRVSRAIPMGYRRAAGLALARAGLGIALFGAGAAVLVWIGDDAFIVWSWLYLYAGRIGAWWIVGWWGAGVRGRRLVGWVVSGTMINVAFDFATVAGMLDGWIWPASILAGIAVFIAVLDRIGRRVTLKLRFGPAPFCRRCNYDLTGNLSGRCPECSTAIQGA